MNKQAELTMDINQFSSQTESLFGLLENFKTLLESESKTIGSSQIDELENILTKKQELSEELEQATQKLEQLLNPNQLNIFTLTENKLFKSFPPDLQQQVYQITTLIQTCHDINLANGMATQTLSNINKHTLDILSGRDTKEVNLYGSSGEKTGKKQTGKPLGTA